MKMKKIICSLMISVLCFMTAISGVSAANTYPTANIDTAVQRAINFYKGRTLESPDEVFAAESLGVEVEDFGKIALTSTSPVKIAARCTVFAESDLIHKAQVGHSKEDIIAGLCKSIVTNYLNNVGKGKKIVGPIVFQGGVSKNVGVLKYFKEILGQDIIVDPNSHLMGAIGIAILSRRCKTNKVYDLSIADVDFETRGFECMDCSNNCEVLRIFKDNKLVDAWGSKCHKYN